jgi:hypothetical protein
MNFIEGSVNSWGFNPAEKDDFVSWDDDMTFPTYGKIHHF